MTPPASALALAHPDPGVREDAARALVAEGGPAAAAAVAPLIAHDDLAVRNLAGDVLVRLGAPSVDVLEGALADADADVRKFAVDVLAQLPAERLAGPIAALLEDADANVRLAAVDALGALGAAPYAAELAARYWAEPLARPSVVAALSGSGAPEATAIVLEALTDDDALVQLAAAEAVADLDVDALPLLRGAFERAAGSARAIVIDALVRWAEARPEVVLPEGVADDLLAMLADPDPAYRLSAARGLRRLGGRIDVPRALVHAGQDDGLDVVLFETLVSQPAPFEALAEAGPGMVPYAAASFAAALLGRGAVPASALPEAAAFLTERLPELDADTKLAIVTLCGRLGQPALDGLLREAAEDPDPVVAETALDALRVRTQGAAALAASPAL